MVGHAKNGKYYDIFIAIFTTYIANVIIIIVKIIE